MNQKPQTDTRRKRRLFPRSLHDVVVAATKPMMDKQGKLYSALIRDWEVIVGEARAGVSVPQRLQFPASEASGATLHLAVHPAYAAELQYATVQILEQCARYFGYKAIERVVLHADYAQVKASPERQEVAPEDTQKKPSQQEARAFFAAMRANLHSTDDR